MKNYGVISINIPWKEKKNDKSKYPINMLLEESLMKKRNDLMDNISHIL
jgi:hypothetical protein